MQGLCRHSAVQNYLLCIFAAFLRQLKISIMKVILSSQCISLTGMLERGLGYHLVQRKNGFFARRDSKGFVPSDGHWRFIVLCAELTRNKLYVTGIKVHWLELQTALYEAKCFTASEQVRRNYTDKCKASYNARDILNLKTTFSL